MALNVFGELGEFKIKLKDNLLSFQNIHKTAFKIKTKILQEDILDSDLVLFFFQKVYSNLKNIFQIFSTLDSCCVEIPLINLLRFSLTRDLSNLLPEWFERCIYHLDTYLLDVELSLQGMFLKY